MDSTDDLNRELARILELLDKINARIESVNDSLREASAQAESEVRRWDSRN